MHVHYDPTYCQTNVAYDTTRKADAIAESLHERPITGAQLTSPSPATIEAVLAVHDHEYVAALQTGSPHHLAASNGLGWDDELFAAVRASTGGVCAATLDALTNRVNSGSLSSGLHHARADRGNGFCTLNGLVIASRAALAAGAKRVLIVDFDAHCGGGTASLIEHMRGVEQIDVSVSSVDRYVSNLNARLAMSDGTDYLGDLQRMLDTVYSPESVDVILYNAGMDPHRDAGGVPPIDTAAIRAREAMVFGWAKSIDVPVAWVLAGGYTTNTSMDGLVNLHRLTIEAAVA